MKFFDRLVNRIEKGEVPFSLYVFTFLSAITLRNFLEYLVAQIHVKRLEWDVPVHYALFYISLGLSIVLLLHLMSGEKIEKVARTVSVGFLIIATVPVTDLLLQIIWRYPITYLYMVPERHEDILRNFLLFFGDHLGAPPGMRLEIFCAMLFCGLYVFSKTKSIIRAVATGVLLYIIIFWCYMAICYLTEWLENALGLPMDTTDRMMMDAYLFLSLNTLIALLYLFKKDFFKAILKDISLSRVLHYSIMAAFGYLIGYNCGGTGFNGLPDFLEAYFLFAAIVFAFLFSTVTNNMADIEIDKISNPKRPTVTGKIPLDIYIRIGFISLFLAIIYSFAAGYMVLFYTLCFICNYFLYSMPPLRLKRVPVLSKAVIGLNSLVIMLAGYTLAGKDILNFPPGIAAFVFICFTLCSNFIDLKDYRGDMAVGIRTLPVMMGMNKSKLAIGLLFALSYALFPYFFGMQEIGVPFIILGILFLFAINKKNYKEGIIFGIYLTSAMLLFIYLLVKGNIV